MKFINIFIKIYIFFSLLFQKVICNSDIKISIVIPVFNTEKYLDRCIQSAINQTLKEIEIICIDDGSTDNSLNILNKYKSIDNRVKVFQNNENKGPSYTRNVGLENAIGEFVGFMDSDDYVDKEYFEKLYSYSLNYDVVVGTFVKSTNLSEHFIKYKNIKKLHGNIIDSIFRKEFLNKYNIRFKIGLNYGQGLEFRKKCYKYNPKIFKSPDEGIYYYYKRREGSLCNYKKKFLRREYKNAIKKYKSSKVPKKEYF